MWTCKRKEVNDCHCNEKNGNQPHMNLKSRKWCRHQFCLHDFIKLFNYYYVIIILFYFFYLFYDCSASCDIAALTHWATQKRMNQSALPALSMREVDLTPAPLFLPVLLDKIGSCRNSSTLNTSFSGASSHCSHFCFVFFFLFLALIAAEETSQCRSCQSRTWGLACWECFWGSCWRSPLMDPTPCHAHPGGSKVTLDYTSY